MHTEVVFVVERSANMGLLLQLVLQRCIRPFVMRLVEEGKVKENDKDKENVDAKVENDENKMEEKDVDNTLSFGLVVYGDCVPTLIPAKEKILYNADSFTLLEAIQQLDMTGYSLYGRGVLEGLVGALELFEESKERLGSGSFSSGNMDQNKETSENVRRYCILAALSSPSDAESFSSSSLKFQDLNLSAFADNCKNENVLFYLALHGISSLEKAAHDINTHVASNLGINYDGFHLSGFIKPNAIVDPENAGKLPVPLSPTVSTDMFSPMVSTLSPSTEINTDILKSPSMTPTPSNESILTQDRKRSATPDFKSSTDAFSTEKNILLQSPSIKRQKFTDSKTEMSNDTPNKNIEQNNIIKDDSKMSYIKVQNTQQIPVINHSTAQEGFSHQQQHVLIGNQPQIPVQQVSSQPQMQQPQLSQLSQLSQKSQQSQQSQQSQLSQQSQQLQQPVQTFNPLENAKVQEFMAKSTLQDKQAWAEKLTEADRLNKLTDAQRSVLTYLKEVIDAQVKQLQQTSNFAHITSQGGVSAQLPTVTISSSTVEVAWSGNLKLLLPNKANTYGNSILEIPIIISRFRTYNLSFLQLDRWPKMELIISEKFQALNLEVFENLTNKYHPPLIRISPGIYNSQMPNQHPQIMIEQFQLQQYAESVVLFHKSCECGFIDLVGQDNGIVVISTGAPNVTNGQLPQIGDYYFIGMLFVNNTFSQAKKFIKENSKRLQTQQQLSEQQARQIALIQRQQQQQKQQQKQQQQQQQQQQQLQKLQQLQQQQHLQQQLQQQQMQQQQQQQMQQQQMQQQQMQQQQMQQQQMQQQQMQQQQMQQQQMQQQQMQQHQLQQMQARYSQK